MTTITREAPTSAVATALHRNSLGVPSVSFFLLAGVGSLMVTAGLLPAAFAVTGLTAMPVYFLAVGAVFAVFLVGYVAMAQRVPNAGAFYALVRFGLGRPAGVAAALVAVVAYNALQVGLYGIVGATAASFAADKLGIHQPWWVWALTAWLPVAVLGLREVKVSARVLGILSLAEIAVIVALSTSGLAHPGPVGLAFDTLSPAHLLVPGVGAAGVLVVLGYTGLEVAPVLIEEARDPRRTVGRASYLSLAGVAAVYVLASLAMVTHYGADHVASVAAAQGPGTLFGLGSPLLGDIALGLFITSAFAALLTFHGIFARYMFSLGRETVLPRAFGRTGQRSGAPWVASTTQSALALLVILGYALFRLDPVVHLFFWVGTTGGFGVLLLLAVTSAAVVVFFARNPQGESVWRRLAAPLIATTLLTAMVVLAVVNYGDLLGVAPGSLVAVLYPAAFAVPALVGLVWALVLRSTRRAVYDAIGRGPQAALTAGELAR